MMPSTPFFPLFGRSLAFIGNAALCRSTVSQAPFQFCHLGEAVDHSTLRRNPQESVIETLELNAFDVGMLILLEGIFRFEPFRASLLIRSGIQVSIAPAMLQLVTIQLQVDRHQGTSTTWFARAKDL